MAEVTEGSITSGSGGFTNTQGVYNTNWLELHWRRLSVSGQVSTIQWRIRFVGAGSPLERTRISQCRLRITPVTGTLKINNTTYTSMAEIVVLPYNTGRAFGWSSIFPNETGWAPAQGDSSYSVNWDNTTYLGGTFTITHSNGVGKFTLQLQANVYEHGSNGWDGRYNTPAGTAVTFELPVTTTACTAPTSVTASGIVKPGGTFTVSWSGADNGVNNTISSYRVYYNISANGTAPTTSTTTYVDVTSTSKSDSTTITVPSNATRAYKIVCGVVTRGTAGASFYSGIKTGGSVTINSLPAKPALNPGSNVVLPSTQSEQIVTATAGTDSDSSQNIGIRYALSTDPDNKFVYSTSGVAISPSSGTSQTWWFWSWDGLEYSAEYAAITVTANTKPVVSAVSATVQQEKFGGSTTPSSTYCSGYGYLVTPSVTCTKTGTLHVVAYISSSISSPSWAFQGELTSQTITQTTSQTLVEYNMHTILPTASPYGATRTDPIYWRLGFYLNDGVENSDTVYFTGAKNGYAIPGAPTTAQVTIYNQWGTSDISGTNSGEIATKFTVKFPKDTSVASGISSINSISLIKTGTTTSYQVGQNSFTYSGDYAYLQLQITSDVPSETSLTGTITYRTSDLLRTKTFSFTVKETAKPSMGTLTYNPGTIYPFSVSGSATTNILMPWPFPAKDITVNTQATWNTVLQYYNCSTTVATAVQFIEASSNTGTNSYNITSSLNNQGTDNLKWIRNGDNLQGILLKSIAYPFNNKLGVTSNNYTGTLTYYAALKITNLFGQEFIAWTASRQFNFNEKVTNVMLSDFCWRKQAPSSTYPVLGTASNKYEVALTNVDSSIQTGNYVIQGVYLCFKVSCKAYSTSDITLSSNLTNLRNSTGTIGNQTISAARAIANPTAARSGVTKEFICAYLVPEVTNNNNIPITVTLSVTAGNTTGSKTIKALRLTQGQVSLLTCAKVNSNWDGTLQISDYGINTSNTGLVSTKQWTLRDNTQQVMTVYNLAHFTDAVKSFNKPDQSSPTTWTSKTVFVQMTMSASISGTAKNGSTTVTSTAVTKTTNSNTLAVYTDAPTVSYRPNAIGINASDLENYSAAAILVNAASNKNIIILKSAQKTITINLDEGRIY